MKNRLVRAVAVLCCGVMIFGECHITAVKDAQERRALVEKPLIAGANAAVSLSYDEALVLADTKKDKDTDQVKSIDSSTAPEEVGTGTADKTGKKDKTAVRRGIYGYKNIGIADVSTFLNVRESASKTARRVGKMMPDSACEIKGFEGDWAKIRSGDVTGYVMSSYLLTGKEAKDRARLIMSDTVTVEADVLRVRADASTDSKIITRVNSGTRLVLAPTEEMASKQDAGSEMVARDKLNNEATTPANLDKSSFGSSYASVSVNGKKNKKAGGSDEGLGMEEPLAVDKDVGKDRGSGPGSRDVVDEHFEAFANNDWVEVDIGGKMGFVSTEYVAFSKELTTATAIGAPSKPDEGNKTAVADIVVADTADETVVEEADEEPDADLVGDGDYNDEDPGGGAPPPEELTNEEAPVDDEVDDSDGGAEDSSQDKKREEKTEKSDKTEDPDDDVEVFVVDDENDSDEDFGADDEPEEVGEDFEEDDESEDEEAVRSEKKNKKKNKDKDKETVEEEAEEELTDEETSDEETPDEETPDEEAPDEEAPEEEGALEEIPEEEEPEPVEESGEPDASAQGTRAASYAMQFLGNPYVWGGSSLTNGADCSGFVMSVYANYGISLPHSSAAQSSYGTSVSASDAQPGDLFFYGSGRISHVGIYIGNGQIIHASNKRTGIKISSAYYQRPVAVKRMF